MRNLLFSLAAGLVVFGLLFGTKLLSAGESALPAILAVTITFFLLARRTFKRVEAIFLEASSGLQTMPPNFAHAIATMEQAYAYAPYQFGVRSQIDTQIGVIYFLQQEFNKALPYLERSARFGHWLGGAMLAVVYYKKKNHDAMKQTFELLKRRAKKEGLMWNLYAYLLTQIGEMDQAQAALIEGVKRTKGDAKVKDSLLALQNGKKIKMKAYKEQWYQFHLEKPPTQYQMAPHGARMDRSAFRGRW